jgi:hypothetical protein
MSFVYDLETSNRFKKLSIGVFSNKFNLEIVNIKNKRTFPINLLEITFY